MDSFLSRKNATNILLVSLVVINLVALIVFAKTFGKMQRTLDYIGDNTWKTESSLGQIEDNTRYIQYR